MDVPVSRRRSTPARLWLGAVFLVVMLLTPALGLAAAPTNPSGPVQEVTPLGATRSAVVDFAALARAGRLALQQEKPPIRPLIHDEEEGFVNNEYGEPGAPPILPELLPAPPPFAPFSTLVASPGPTIGFPGLDDIPMVDSSYIVIPPDVSGAVGDSRILAGHNNNYRLLDKSNGAVITTLGTATFWAPVATGHLNELTDPRTLYDPYNDRWIAVMQTTASGAGMILLAVSQTGNPEGAWTLYSFNVGATIDFPNVGFNKNWIVIAINRYSVLGTFQRGVTLVVDYPSARAGTGTGTLFTQASGTHFSSSPCVTYSTTSETLYVVTHLTSASATYQLDAITGTAGSPVYTAGGTLTRPGGGWTTPSGNLLPQSAPVSGTSACGGTPCPIESQDSNVRSAPTFRDGLIYYAQTVGLPAGAMTHTAVQWTVLNTPTGTVAEGGRIDDPTATSTNGGKWHAFPHIAVNANHDILVGYSQFSSAQHPSAGYSSHLAGDGAGTIRDPLIYQPGEDYYHKTFSTTTGRNRWGDFSTVQVDPADDMTLWTVQEYGKNRPGINDGNTGSNSSRWSTWWAGLAPPIATIAGAPIQSEGDAGTTAFNFTVQLSYAYGLPVTVNYQTSDGSATVADNDYQPVNTSVIVPAGSTSVPITINAVGDLTCESSETFSVTLTSTNNHIPLGAAVVATGTIQDDEDATIAASAGSNGIISPTGAVAVTCGTDQTFTITPDAGFAVDQLLVDGSPVTAAPSYTFTNVVAGHTIDASFISVTGVEAAAAQFALGPVLPNPSRGAMQVQFGLPSAANVRVAVVDLQGRELAVLAQGEFPAGWHQASWNGRTPHGPVGAGVYFVRYQAAGKALVRKFALTR